MYITLHETTNGCFPFLSQITQAILKKRVITKNKLQAIEARLYYYYFTTKGFFIDSIHGV